MGGVSANSKELLQVVQNMQTAINSIEFAKHSISRKYQQLGVFWNDKKYLELGEIVQEITKALNGILKILLQGEKYILQLYKAVQEYDGVKLNGVAETAMQGVSQILQVPSNIDNLQKQTEHRSLIEGRQEQISGVMDDIKNGSGRNINRSQAEKMLDSLHEYSGPYYKDIRYAYKNPNAPESLRNALNNVDEYINGAPKWEGRIYRGINISRQIAESILNSETIDMLGPSSWSTSEEIAQKFSDGSEPVRMVFVLNDNHSGASITHLATYNGSEEEVLAPSGIEYVLDRIEESMNNGHEYIYVYVHEQS